MSASKDLKRHWSLNMQNLNVTKHLNLSSLHQFQVGMYLAYYDSLVSQFLISRISVLE